MHILRRIPYYGFLALLAYMPFHVFLSQSLSLATGGLEAWKIAKDIILFGLVLFTICLVFVKREGGRLFYVLLGGAGLYGLVHLAMWALNSNLYADSAILGIAYNNRLMCFLLLGYGAALLNRDKFVFSSLIRLVLVLSTAVAFLGVVQYFLPKDILSHLGYSLDRGVRPAFFIDDHPDLPRIMSTLREPNALAAYLVLPLAALTALLMKVRQVLSRLLLGVSWLVHGAALFLTQSRSGWLAALLAIAIVLWYSFGSAALRTMRRLWPVLLAVLLLGVVSIWQLRDTAFVENYIVHTSEAATGEYSSTELHYILAREGAEIVLERPIGHGPGTAGLVSIHNPLSSRLTENYYIQIAYEVGVFGLLVFIAIQVVVYVRLHRRGDMFGHIMIAAFWGYVVTNMLLHTWSNEAVAAQWWLLAGVALAGTLGARATPDKTVPDRS